MSYRHFDNSKQKWFGYTFICSSKGKVRGKQLLLLDKLSCQMESAKLRTYPSLIHVLHAFSILCCCFISKVRLYKTLEKLQVQILSLDRKGYTVKFFFRSISWNTVSGSFHETWNTFMTCFYFSIQHSLHMFLTNKNIVFTEKRYRVKFDITDIVQKIRK